MVGYIYIHTRFTYIQYAKRFKRKKISKWLPSERADERSEATITITILFANAYLRLDSRNSFFCFIKRTHNQWKKKEKEKNNRTFDWIAEFTESQVRTTSKCFRKFFNKLEYVAAMPFMHIYRVFELPFFSKLIHPYRVSEENQWEYDEVWFHFSGKYIYSLPVLVWFFLSFVARLLEQGKRILNKRAVYYIFICDIQFFWLTLRALMIIFSTILIRDRKWVPFNGVCI